MNPGLRPLSACPDAQTTETAIAPAVFVNGGPDSRLVEIRPEAGQENELGIGRLPSEEVRHPLLARSPDHQIRIWNAMSIESRSHRIHIDVGRIERPLLHPARKSSHGADDLLAPAIIEGNDQSQTGVAPGELLRLVQQQPDVRGQAFALADDPDPDIIG